MGSRSAISSDVFDKAPIYRLDERQDEPAKTLDGLLKKNHAAHAVLRDPRLLFHNHLPYSYFKTRYVMFERRSLETLLDISKHVNFAPHINTLEFDLYHLLPLDEVVEIQPPFSPYEKMMTRTASENKGNDSNNSIDSTSSQDNHLSRLNEGAYRNQWNDQHQLMRAQYALDCLTMAMLNLSQCKNITFDDSNRPWGLGSVEVKVGILPQRSLTFDSNTSVRLVRHILDIVLSAAVASKIEIEDLDISAGCSMENANRVSPDMLPRLSAPITSLRHLRLVLDPDFPESVYSGDWEVNLVQFIHSFPELTHFVLGFENRDEFFRFSEASPSIYIPKLENLVIGLVDCTSDEVAGFLVRHRETLREISFDSVDLTDGLMAWQILIQKIHDELNITYLSMIDSMARGRDVQDREPLEATDRRGLIEIIDRLQEP
ncbi:hypothetical protein IWW34DRAFT_794955 [Fusarium oxysporum f. sp. albedinis]|nr:hypothetical protein IWW34DRAFT_794955 [Fusarium oxysporum f. sp. albedinis]